MISGEHCGGRCRRGVYVGSEGYWQPSTAISYGLPGLRGHLALPKMTDCVGIAHDIASIALTERVLLPGLGLQPRARQAQRSSIDHDRDEV